MLQKSTQKAGHQVLHMLHEVECVYLGNLIVTSSTAKQLKIEL